MCQPGGNLPVVFSLDDLWMDGLMDGGCLSYPLLPSSSSQYPFLPSLWCSLHLWSSLCPLVIIMRRDQRLVTWWWDDIWTQSLTWRLIVISLYDSLLKIEGLVSIPLCDLLLSHQLSGRGCQNQLWVLLWGLSACLWLTVSLQSCLEPQDIIDLGYNNWMPISWNYLKNNLSLNFGFGNLNYFLGSGVLFNKVELLQ